MLRSCRRPWPHDPADPRVGVYLSSETEEHPAFVLMFDGATVTKEWHGFSNLPRDCVYGELEDAPPVAYLRTRAHVRPRDQMLWSLDPCIGWQALGRFRPDGAFELAFARGAASRAPLGDLTAFQAIDWSEDEDLLFWRCQEPYRAADGDPIPDPPR